MKSNKLAVLAICVALSLSAGCNLQMQQIEPTPPDEAAVETRIKQALIDDKRVDAAAVEVGGDAKSIELSGFVASEDEHAAVLETAKRLYPDKSIDDRIEVK